MKVGDYVRTKYGISKILKLEERSEKKRLVKIIYLESKNKKEKCPICNKYTSSIHIFIVN